MTNTLTIDQLKELLQIQKSFDDRIPTKNPKDTHKAYVVEFFEWYNTIEPFKNWKKNKGKPREQQLDELSDMMAFSLSYWLMKYTAGGKIETKMPSESELYHFIGDVLDIVDFEKHMNVNNIHDKEFDNLDIKQILSVLEKVSLKYVFKIAIQYYSLSELITSYKQKMERNHARQDGTADKDKGYV